MTYSAKNKAFGKRQTTAYDMLIREESSLAAALQRDDDDTSVPTADEMWEAFDAGIADSITADLATYTDEDYGIPTDSGE